MKNPQRKKKKEKETDPHKISPPPSCLYDGKLGGRDVEGVDVGSESREGFLGSVGSAVDNPLVQRLVEKRRE